MAYDSDEPGRLYARPQADRFISKTGYLERRLEQLNEQFVADADVEVLREIEEVQVLLGMPPS